MQMYRYSKHRLLIYSQYNYIKNAFILQILIRKQLNIGSKYRSGDKTMGRLSGYAATFLVVLVAVTSSTTRAALTPSEPFSGSTSLVNGDVYHLFWKNNQSHITFEVHAKVKGWVGFGISPNGGMPNSDIVIGWVKDGVPYFQVQF